MRALADKVLPESKLMPEQIVTNWLKANQTFSHWQSCLNQGITDFDFHPHLFTCGTFCVNRNRAVENLYQLQYELIDNLLCLKQEMESYTGGMEALHKLSLLHRHTLAFTQWSKRIQDALGRCSARD